MRSRVLAESRRPRSASLVVSSNSVYPWLGLLRLTTDVGTSTFIEFCVLIELKTTFNVKHRFDTQIFVSSVLEVFPIFPRWPKLEYFCKLTLVSTFPERNEHVVLSF